MHEYCMRKYPISDSNSFRSREDRRLDRSSERVRYLQVTRSNKYGEAAQVFTARTHAILDNSGTRVIRSILSVKYDNTNLDLFSVWIRYLKPDPTWKEYLGSMGQLPDMIQKLMVEEGPMGQLPRCWWSNLRSALWAKPKTFAIGGHDNFSILWRPSNLTSQFLDDNIFTSY